MDQRRRLVADVSPQFKREGRSIPGDSCVVLLVMTVVFLNRDYSYSIPPKQELHWSLRVLLSFFIRLPYRILYVYGRDAGAMNSANVQKGALTSGMQMVFRSSQGAHSVSDRRLGGGM